MYYKNNFTLYGECSYQNAIAYLEEVEHKIW